MVPEFDSEGLLVWLDNQPDEVLDTTIFGIVKMDRQSTVLFYNKAETGISGVSREYAVGKHFFKQVAPCTNNFMVAEKYKKDELDEKVQYIFTYVTKPIPVLLRLLKGAGENQYMLVKKV